VNVRNVKSWWGSAERAPPQWSFSASMIFASHALTKRAIGCLNSSRSKFTSSSVCTVNVIRFRKYTWMKSIFNWKASDSQSKLKIKLKAKWFHLFVRIIKKSKLSFGATNVRSSYVHYACSNIKFTEMR